MARGQRLFFSSRLISASNHPRQLKADEDVDQLLQETYPLIDDTKARAALVAAFAHRHEVRARRRHLLTRGAVVLAVVILLVMADDRWVGARLRRLGRHLSPVMDTAWRHWSPH